MIMTKPKMNLKTLYTSFFQEPGNEFGLSSTHRIRADFDDNRDVWLVGPEHNVQGKILSPAIKSETATVTELLNEESRTELYNKFCEAKDIMHVSTAEFALTQMNEYKKFLATKNKQQELSQNHIVSYFCNLAPVEKFKYISLLPKT